MDLPGNDPQGILPLNVGEVLPKAAWSGQTVGGKARGALPATQTSYAASPIGTTGERSSSASTRATAVHEVSSYLWGPAQDGAWPAQTHARSSSPSVAFNTWNANPMGAATAKSAVPVPKLTARSCSPAFIIPADFQPPPGLERPGAAGEGIVRAALHEKTENSKLRGAQAKANSEPPPVRCDPASSTDAGAPEPQATLEGDEKRLSYGQRRRQRQRERRRSDRSQSTNLSVDGEPAATSADTEVQLANEEIVPQALEEDGKQDLQERRQRLQEGAALATQARALMRAQLEEAWELFQREFETQQLVWSSLSLVQHWDAEPDFHPELELQSAVENAFQSATVNLLHGAIALKRALNLDSDHGGLLNAPSRLAALAVIAKGTLAQPRLQLAELLEKNAAGDEAALELIRSCDMGDFEAVALRFLGLPTDATLAERTGTTVQQPLPVTEGQQEKKTKTKPKDKPQKPCKGKRDKQRERTPKSDEAYEDSPDRHGKSNQSISGLSLGSFGSASKRSGNSRRSLRKSKIRSGSLSQRSSRSSRSQRSSSRSRKSSDSKGSYSAATAAKANSAFAKTLQELKGKTGKGTPVHGRERGAIGSAMQATTAEISSERSDVSGTAGPGSAEGAAAATAVHALAADELAMAWHMLEQEFGTQVLVWSSRQMVSRAQVEAFDAEGCLIADDEADLATLQSRLKSLVTTAAVDPSSAARALESLLHWDADRALLSNVMRNAAKQVIDSADTAQWRWGLAEALERASNGESLRQRTHAELQDLIVRCNLGNLGLEYRVRRVLGLDLGNLLERWRYYRHDSSQAQSSGATIFTYATSLQQPGGPSHQLRVDEPATLMFGTEGDDFVSL